MKKVIFLLSAALLLVMADSGCAKKERSIFAGIYGVVTDNTTGDPIAVASVVLSPSGKTTVTGSDGTFEFPDVDAGQYTVTVQKAGYQTNRKTITAISGESSPANIPLTKSN
jgi:hypothetical protein